MAVNEQGVWMPTTSSGIPSWQAERQAYYSTPGNVPTGEGIRPSDVAAYDAAQQAEYARANAAVVAQQQAVASQPQQQLQESYVIQRAAQQQAPTPAGFQSVMDRAYGFGALTERLVPVASQAATQAWQAVAADPSRRALAEFSYGSGISTSYNPKTGEYETTNPYQKYAELEEQLKTMPRGAEPPSGKLISVTMPQEQKSASGTVYVPYGSRTQQELKDIAAIRYTPEGEVGFYQKIYDPRTGKERNITNLVASGSEAALQSGMFSTKPLTVDVRTQYAPSKYAETAMPEYAEIVKAYPESFSRLGAEAYGGFVSPLDARTISDVGAQPGRYASETGNLAALITTPGAVAEGIPTERVARLPWGEGVTTTPLKPVEVVMKTTYPLQPTELPSGYEYKVPFISARAPTAVKSPDEQFVSGLGEMFGGFGTDLQRTTSEIYAMQRERTGFTGLIGMATATPVGGAYGTAAKAIPVVAAGAATLFAASELSKSGFALPTETPRFDITPAPATEAAKLDYTGLGAASAISTSLRGGVARAKELWEESPIANAPGGYRLPEIRDVIPSQIAQLPGRGYETIAKLPGKGYEIVANVPGAGLGMLAKAGSAAVGVGGGVAGVIQIPKPTISPADVVTPVASTYEQYIAQVQEPAATAERAIYDLSVPKELAKSTEYARAVETPYSEVYAPATPYPYAVVYPAPQAQIDFATIPTVTTTTTPKPPEKPPTIIRVPPSLIQPPGKIIYPPTQTPAPPKPPKEKMDYKLKTPLLGGLDIPAGAGAGARGRRARAFVEVLPIGLDIATFTGRAGRAAVRGSARVSKRTTTKAKPAKSKSSKKK